MPIYEYTCAPCGEKREVLVRSAEGSDAPRCPVCGAPMQKAWSAVACHSKASAGACRGGGGFS